MTALDTAHEAFTKWLGNEYDLVALDAVLFTAAAEKLGGDPPWLLVISGSGAAKTETVVPLVGAGAFIVGSISGEAALLSGTPAKDRAKDATGGLLKKMEVGKRGLLVVKDFTSIISMSRDARAKILAALREIHDGHWVRDLGTEGGRTIPWTGRIVLIGACTTAYDSAHSVIAAMGDRFALVRIDSSRGRVEAGMHALRNVDHEKQMRGELVDTVKDVMSKLDASRATLTDDDMTRLLDVADLVTFARTPVEHDYQGNVIEAHAPEMPTRFAKMLGQIMRGGLALGADRGHALDVALRVAGDSMPPLRLEILDAVGRLASPTTMNVHKALQRPRTTVDRGLQDLHELGLLTRYEADQGAWRYGLSGQVDRDVLKTLVSSNGNNRFRGFLEERECVSKAGPAKAGHGIYGVQPNLDSAEEGGADS